MVRENSFPRHPFSIFAKHIYFASSINMFRLCLFYVTMFSSLCFSRNRLCRFAPKSIALHVNFFRNLRAWVLLLFMLCYLFHFVYFYLFLLLFFYFSIFYFYFCYFIFTQNYCINRSNFFLMML